MSKTQFPEWMAKKFEIIMKHAGRHEEQVPQEILGAPFTFMTSDGQQINGTICGVDVAEVVVPQESRREIAIWLNIDAKYALGHEVKYFQCWEGDDWKLHVKDSSPFEGVIEIGYPNH